MSKKHVSDGVTYAGDKKYKCRYCGERIDIQELENCYCEAQ